MSPLNPLKNLRWEECKKGRVREGEGGRESERKGRVKMKGKKQKNNESEK